MASKISLASRCASLTFCAATSVSLALACTQEPKHPPQLPMVTIYDKACSRLGVSELVVKDQERRDRVQAIYRGIAERVEQLQVHRASSNARLLDLSRARELDELAVRAEVMIVRRDTERAFSLYVDQQMQLRKMLTQKEFNQLRKFN